MPTSRSPLRPPPGQTPLAARLAAPDQADQVVGTPHPEKTGWDKISDARMVLAKGAGPGIWNRWESHVAGHRIFWSRVDSGYLV